MCQLKKIPIIFISFLFLILLANTAMGYTVQDVEVRFTGEGIRQTISSIEKDGILYIPIDDFAGLLNLRHYFIDQNNKFVIRSGSHAIKLMGENPFFMIDEQLYQLPLPTLFQDNHVFIPISLFLAIAKDALPAKIQVSSNNRIIQVQRRLYNITGVQVEERANGSLVRFTTTKRFSEKDVAASFRRGWLNVTFYDGTLDSSKIATENKVGMVQKILPIQFETSAQLSFLLDREFKEKQFYFTENEVVLTLRSSQKIDATALNPLPDDNKRWVIDRIVIDPGHGGRDPGAVGPTGLKEKDVVLDISKRLKKMLEKNLDVEVLMTRSDDTYVKVQDRGKFANEKKGKLFISIHANGNESNRVRGHSVWLLGLAKSDMALKMQEKENSVIDMEEDTEIYEDLIHIMNRISQSVNLKESQELAGIVDSQFKDLNKFPKYGNGIFQAGFYVLVNAAMPKILVETAHITNKYEERLLKTNSVRQQIAQALYLSIKEFKSKYERGN